LSGLQDKLLTLASHLRHKEQGISELLFIANIIKLS
jgi:hypothetical protein